MEGLPFLPGNSFTNPTVSVKLPKFCGKYLLSNFTWTNYVLRVKPCIPHRVVYMISKECFEILYQTSASTKRYCFIQVYSEIL